MKLQNNIIDRLIHAYNDRSEALYIERQLELFPDTKKHSKKNIKNTLNVLTACYLMVTKEDVPSIKIYDCLIALFQDGNPKQRLESNLIDISTYPSFLNSISPMSIQAKNLIIK